MNVATLLQLINEQHGTVFELLARYSSGEQGAFAITDQDGRRYVLKWEARDTATRFRRPYQERQWGR